MYGNMLPKTGVGLALGGLALSALDLAWIGIAIAVLGGALITIAKLMPRRVAIEPIPVGVNDSRLTVTVDGRPVGARVGEDTRRLQLHDNAQPGPYGVANWQAPLTEFEQRAGVIPPNAPGRHRPENVTTRVMDGAAVQQALLRDRAV
ncbi:hypothetical protein [Paractinoplanes atraurantiacus]|uniref:Uncharacterized protein n=1 Tax=Paractinoplanes atraurantiacus TaxID=1036182 RepID=A0A285H036_9ACTN|nr:hypothetical protein [Actinoplanes atraurantiacus]SNY28923.1 hypothetical protein SAMN05421748_103158 [Actinoplanes atraurantiacus]